MADAELSTTRWQTYRRALIATLPPICSICGHTIDKTLPGTHRDGPTIDHRTPRSRGGHIYDRTNCALAHQRCNSGKRDALPRTTHSRDW